MERHICSGTYYEVTIAHRSLVGERFHSEFPEAVLVARTVARCRNINRCCRSNPMVVTSVCSQVGGGFSRPDPSSACIITLTGVEEIPARAVVGAASL